MTQTENETSNSQGAKIIHLIWMIRNCLGMVALKYKKMLPEEINGNNEQSEMQIRYLDTYSSLQEISATV